MTLPFDYSQRPVPPPVDAPAWQYPYESDFARFHALRDVARPYSVLEARCDLFELPRPGRNSEDLTDADCAHWIAAGEAIPQRSERPALLLLVPSNALEDERDPVLPIALPSSPTIRLNDPRLVRGDHQSLTERPFFMHDWKALYRVHPTRLHTQHSPPLPRFFSSWAYATTLSTPDEPLYLPRGDYESRESRAAFEEAYCDGMVDDSGGVGVATIEALIAELPHASSSHVLDHAIGAALSLARADLALALSKRYLPFGYCSHDTGPTMAQRRYATLCARLGLVVPAVALVTSNIAGGLDRNAWSTEGEALQETSAEMLERLGVDPALFLRGMTLAYHVPGVGRSEVATWRIARALCELGRAEESIATMRALTCDPALDVYNQIQAAAVWWHLLRELRERRERVPGDGRVDLEVLAAEPEVPATTRIWLAAMRGE